MLGLIAITGWRVFVAARKLGLTVQRSQQRVGEIMPPLQAALDELAAYEAGHHAPGGNLGRHRGNPGSPGAEISRTEQLARWDSIRPAPWTTDGRRISGDGSAADGPDRIAGRAEYRTERRAEHRTERPTQDRTERRVEDGADQRG